MYLERPFYKTQFTSSTALIQTASLNIVFHQQKQTVLSTTSTHCYNRRLRLIRCHQYCLLNTYSKISTERKLLFSNDFAFQLFKPDTSVKLRSVNSTMCTWKSILLFRERDEERKEFAWNKPTNSIGTIRGMMACSGNDADTQ